MAYRRHHSSLYAAADAVADRGSHLVYETILPYQGWALINPADMVGQNRISFMQLLPYVLQSGILILFAVLFCWLPLGPPLTTITPSLWSPPFRDLLRRRRRGSGAGNSCQQPAIWWCWTLTR